MLQWVSGDTAYAITSMAVSVFVLWKLTAIFQYFSPHFAVIRSRYQQALLYLAGRADALPAQYRDGSAQAYSHRLSP